MCIRDRFRTSMDLLSVVAVKELGFAFHRAFEYRDIPIFSSANSGCLSKSVPLEFNRDGLNICDGRSMNGFAMSSSSFMTASIGSDTISSMEISESAI